ncbi:uncharacterized protein A1O9_10725 [Exophiala aquamarina CBS 119918]|uniref:C6 finger domain-containing protein n=1 Tax=Exophiala aquamarina CBS 119918 TaxID=1182545 RepID=A0A072P0U2_9EURO|nr:uncharacterized protein A1O9_10725 [Exophiala aquamarina CBS 119918]KEF53277.1 hypothetical protein A1O9_10725 [Exophiala aquamarina CBS 119918]
MTHLQLLNNLSSKEFLSMEADDQVSIMSSVIFARYILPTPYLIHEALALSALHMSTKSPESQGFYRQYATGLQTRALALFNDSIPVLDLNSTNCTPMFLFASLIAAHLLCDTLHHEKANLDHFIEKFTNCLTIHHGILAISSQCWDLLRETELGPRLTLGAELMRAKDDCGSDCSALNEMLDAADISPESYNVYRKATSELQKVFDAERAYPASQFDSQLVSAWPISVSSEYIDLLRQQTPQSLIILAYYAVLLHRSRHSWLYGEEGGRFLIESICGRLEATWHDWLKFPKSVLLAYPAT